MDHFSDISKMYEKLTVRADMLYEFVILYHNYIYAQHTYEVPIRPATTDGELKKANLSLMEITSEKISKCG